MVPLKGYGWQEGDFITELLGERIITKASRAILKVRNGIPDH
jgi:hypothetical protein